MLCFQTSNERDIDLALRYWALNTDGKWAESAAAIADSHGCSQVELLALVQSSAFVHDLESCCFWCQSPVPLTTRTSWSSSYKRNSGFRQYQKPAGAQFCPDCEAKNQQKQLEAARAEEYGRRAHINQALVQVAHRQVRLKLDELSTIDAVYFLALMLAAKTEVAQDDSEVFILNGRLSGSESVDSEICQRLFAIGAITPSTKCNPDAVKVGSDGKISFAWQNVAWELGQGIKGIRCLNLCDDLSEFLDTQQVSPVEVETMWLHVASAECETVLLGQLNYYHLGDYVVDDKTLQAFHYALERLSIPQVWGIIYSVTKNAASLRQSRTYTAVQIRGMIPQMIISLVDRTFDQNWVVYARSRKQYHIEGSLTSIFFSRIMGEWSDAFRSATTITIRQRFFDGRGPATSMAL